MFENGGGVSGNTYQAYRNFAGRGLVVCPTHV